MKVEMFCDGVTVHQIAEFLAKEAGNKVPVPGQTRKRVKIPRRMKVLERSEDMMLMKYWSLRFTAVNMKGGAQITSEIKWVLSFWICLISGIIIWPLLISALSMLIGRYSVWPAQRERFNRTVCEGAKTLPVQS